MSGRQTLDTINRIPDNRRMNFQIRAAQALFVLLSIASPLFAAPKFTVAPTLELNPNPAAPLAGALKFQASSEVSTSIVGETEGHRFAIEYGIEQNPSNGLPVVGMRAGKRYTITVAISDSSGKTTYPKPLEIQSPDLPDRPDLMPRIVVESNESDSVSPGPTLFNPRRRIPIAVADSISAESEFNANLGMLAVVDSEGEVIWYYHGDSRITDYRPISNGNIVFITADNRLIEIDMLGNTVASWCAANRPATDGECPEGSIPVDLPTIHHSFQEYENGDFLILSTEIRELPDYFTSETDVDAPRKTQQVVGDVVVRMTREGEILWRWNAFDHLDPYQIGYLTFSNYWTRRGFPNTVDWSHANAVRIVDDGDSFLVNFRLISGIAKVDVASQEIEWMVITDPQDIEGDLSRKTFSLKGDGDWFWMPHAPWITEDGTLLIFNNDNFGARPFDPALPPAAIRSRAEEYAFDPETRSMTKVWESRFPGEIPLRSWAMGSVQPLPNKNVLVGYGMLFRPEGVESLTWNNRLAHPTWTQIREYSKTQPARLVWSLTLLPLTEETEIGWALYGGLRLPQWPPLGYSE